MRRTTIVADEKVIERLRQIARRDHVSLAQVIRQALELRALGEGRHLTFIASAASSQPPFDVAERSADLPYQPQTWR